jgi:hypothetical protein
MISSSTENDVVNKEVLYVPSYIYNGNMTAGGGGGLDHVSLYCARGLTGLRNMQQNPFANTILDEYVTFPWRPCKEEWQFAAGSLNQTLLSTPPVIFKLFDWVIWQHDRKRYRPLVVFGNHSGNNNPRTVLVYPEMKTMGSLKRQLKRVKTLQLGQRRSLVLAGQDSGLGGKMQRYIHTNFLDYFSDIWCTAKNVPDPFVHAIPLGLNPYYVVKAGIHAVTDIVHSHGRGRRRGRVQSAATSVVSSSAMTETSISRRLWSFKYILRDMLSPPPPQDTMQPPRKLVFAGTAHVCMYTHHVCNESFHRY